MKVTPTVQGSRDQTRCIFQTKVTRVVGGGRTSKSSTEPRIVWDRVSDSEECHLGGAELVGVTQ